MNIHPTLTPWRNVVLEGRSYIETNRLIPSHPDLNCLYKQHYNCDRDLLVMRLDNICFCSINILSKKVVDKWSLKPFWNLTKRRLLCFNTQNGNSRYITLSKDRNSSFMFQTLDTCLTFIFFGFFFSIIKFKLKIILHFCDLYFSFMFQT